MDIVYKAWFQLYTTKIAHLLQGTDEYGYRQQKVANNQCPVPITGYRFPIIGTLRLFLRWNIDLGLAGSNVHFVDTLQCSEIRHNC